METDRHEFPMDEFPRMPLLSREEERRLGLAVRDGEEGSPGWIAARNELVARNQSLLHSVVRERYRGGRREDVIQYCFLAMMNAAAKFDPDREAKFATFAYRPMVEAIIRWGRDHELLIRKSHSKRFARKAIMITGAGLVARGGTPCDQACEREEAARLSGAIANLPPGLRSLVESRFGIVGERATIAEACGEHSVSHTTIKKRTRTAIRLLRSDLSCGRRVGLT